MKNEVFDEVPGKARTDGFSVLEIGYDASDKLLVGKFLRMGRIC